MKKAFGLVLAGILVIFPPTARAAQKSATAIRNLDWASVTLDKVEKDLADVIGDNSLTDTNALAAAFKFSRGRVGALRKSTAEATTQAEDLDKVVEFTKNVSGLAQSVLDRISELDAKREGYRKLINDNASLSRTDIGKRFDEGFHLLAGKLLRMPVCQLEEKSLEANEAEGMWNLQSLRCDQIIEEGWDEAAHLARQDELANGIREAGKTISLNPVAEAWEKVRAGKRQQQQLAMEKQKQANQLSYLNLQTQLLEQKTAKLNEATDLARQAYEEAQQKIQQAIDEN